MHSMRTGSRAEPRLGLFVDAPFRSDGDRVWAGDELLGFGIFAAAVGKRFGSLVLISRATTDQATAPFPLPRGVAHLPLPHYPSLRRLGAVAVAAPATARALWRSLEHVDLVWISAANPVGLMLAFFARLRRRPIAILVRQDTMAYYRTRLPGRAWAPLLVPLWMVDRAFRWLGRRHLTTAVGEETAHTYGAARDGVLQFQVNLFRSVEIPAVPSQRSWDSPVELLTVGRIEPEKTPTVVPEALALLEKTDPGRFHLTWAGEGRLHEQLRLCAESLGVSGALSLPGFVPFGEPLHHLSRRADAFVHVSRTEGVPGVIWEAMACGLPIVATQVGGVRAASGGAALLVAPQDASALADAVRKLASDPELRQRLSSAGLARARRTALDVESVRVAEFLRAGV
jgi:glycosyltransferase involved in cell wall biosynthesis